MLEVDNIATIKDLIRKDLGVSVLPKSACMDELRKEKITALPIENLSMVRETRVVYHKNFAHTVILRCNVERVVSPDHYIDWLLLSAHEKEGYKLSAMVV